MGFLSYSNETQSNIIPQDEFDALINEVFTTISTPLLKSLGPLGSSTTILDGMYTSATKDGFSIFKSIRFHNRYKNMIYNLIKDPCTRLNNTVGDGTTTAIVLTDQLFKAYRNRKDTLDTLYRLPRVFIKAWDTIIEELIEKIKSKAAPIDSNDYDTIYNLCYVTSNGNHEVSRNIAETYKNAKAPVIKLKNSPTNKSYITPITGFEFPANLIDQAYSRSEDLSVEEKDICVMIFNYKIDMDICEQLIIPINNILRSNNKKLLVLAPFYDAYLANTTLKQYVNREYQQYKQLNLILAQYAIGKLEPNQLSDLGIVLRTVIIDQKIGTELLEKFSTIPDGNKYDFIEKMILNKTNDDCPFEFGGVIGTAANAFLSCTNGSIFRVDDIENDKQYQDAIRVAEKELSDVISSIDLESQSYSFEISKARARISQLKMDNYIYYIGSDSALQTNILYDSVDDVVKCIRSAIKSGVIPGCQLSISQSCLEMMANIVGDTENVNNLNKEDKLKLIILEIINTAVTSVYARILHGPNGLGLIKTIPLWEYINKEGSDQLIKEAEVKCTDIITSSIEKNQVFDLETLEFTDTIITSAETDVNILLASSELIKLLISGNQSIFLDAEVNGSHVENVELFK